MEDIKRALITKSYETEGKIRLACAYAFEVAEEFDVELSTIAKICKAEHIKICRCQLDCFK